MKKPSVVIFIIMLIPCFLILLNNKGVSSKIEYNIVFKQKLSEYGLYQGKISELKPCDQAVNIEIVSALFTDYAKKQRIILLPNNKKMIAKGSGLPDFPEGTIIAKTFFYPNNSKATTRSILETRLLIKNKSQWNAATYKWNNTQDEAFLIENGAKVPVKFLDKNGNHKKIEYKIPSKGDCIACHRQNDHIFPIGPKLRNLNKIVNYKERDINQLEYLKQKGKLEITDIAKIESVVDYSNTSESIENRARAYLDINCAHCHNPNGIAFITQMDLRIETPTAYTGIWMKQGKIAMRMSMLGELHMPKIGTTIIHDEGLKLVLDYIHNLKE